MYGSVKKLVLVLGLLALVGCGDNDPLAPQADRPGSLVGAWREVGYARGIVLERDGAFRFVILEDGVAAGVEASGTWEATDDRITLRIRFGQFRWLEDSQNTAPSSMTCDYVAGDSRLTLTFEIMSEVYTIRYDRID